MSRLQHLVLRVGKVLAGRVGQEGRKSCGNPRASSSWTAFVRVGCVFLLAGLGVGACQAPASLPSPTATTAAKPPATIRASATSQAELPTPTPMPAQTGLPSPSPSPSPLPATATPSPSPAPGCTDQSGQFVLGQVETDLLPEPLDYRVYLPPCYQAGQGQHYPVLYLIHGQGFTDDQWERLGAGSTADALITAGETPPFLIVMPRYRRWTQPYDNKFGDALVEVLIPSIDASYDTLPDRQYRAIGGLSRGAGWALHLGLLHFDQFGALGLHTLAMFSTDRAHIIPRLERIPPDQMPRIYMDMDEHDRQDLIRSSLWLENVLTERGIPHEWYLFPGYHVESYWQSHLRDYLRWYAEVW